MYTAPSPARAVPQDIVSSTANPASFGAQRHKVVVFKTASPFVVVSSNHGLRPASIFRPRPNWSSPGANPYTQIDRNSGAGDKIVGVSWYTTLYLFIRQPPRATLRVSPRPSSADGTSPTAPIAHPQEGYGLTSWHSVPRAKNVPMLSVEPSVREKNALTELRKFALD